MTENPKSCKFRVFQSENNYSPHHEHVHTINIGGGATASPYVRMLPENLGLLGQNCESNTNNFDCYDNLESPTGPSARTLIYLGNGYRDHGSSR